MPNENHYDDEIEITDCMVCGILLPENMICPQCGTSHKEILPNASNSGIH